MVNERGSVLIFTLMVILILTVLGVAILEVTITNYKISHAYANSISASYAAEAALDIAKNEFNDQLLSDLSQRAQNIINNTNEKIPREFLYQSIYSVVQNYLQENVFYKYPKSGYLGDTGQKYTIQSMTLDSNYNRLTYIIHINTTGEYKNIKKEGYAELILNLESFDPLTVSKWEIK